MRTGGIIFSKNTVEGESVEEKTLIIRHFVDFYKNLYAEDFHIRPVFDGLELD